MCMNKKIEVLNTYKMIISKDEAVITLMKLLMEYNVGR